MDVVKFFKTVKRLCKNQGCDGCPVCKNNTCILYSKSLKSIEKHPKKIQQASSRGTITTYNTSYF